MEELRQAELKNVIESAHRLLVAGKIDEREYEQLVYCDLK
jgi:hypothetical protein